MSDSKSGPTSGSASGSKLGHVSTDPNNPEAQALPANYGAASDSLRDAPRDRSLSDVVLYDDPMPPVQATSTSTAPANAKSGSSANPGLMTPGSSRPVSIPGASSSGSSPSAKAARTATPVPIAWRVWPVVDSVWELLGLTVVLIVVPLVVWSLSGRTALTAICTIAVGAVVWRHFVPTICEINALGVTEKIFSRTRRIPWLSIDRYVVGRKGVFLTSAGAPLEVFRGLYLPWGSHRDQILSSLRYYLPNAEDKG